MKFKKSRNTVKLNFPLVKGIIIALIGFLFCLPIVYFVVYGKNSIDLTLSRFISFCLFLVGGPMFFFGIIVSFNRNNNVQSLNDIDLARIRHSVETDSLRRK